MQMKDRKKLLSSILCIVLIVAIALSTTGCNNTGGNTTPSASGTEKSISTEGTTQTKDNVSVGETTQTKDSVSVGETAQIKDGISTEKTVLGEGTTTFLFSVVDKEGSETQFEIHTNKETVGEALQELALIDGEEGKFGLYVKTVNGITLDYNTDGKYWAFYINNEYALTGVDATTITEGDSYSFKVE